MYRASYCNVYINQQDTQILVNSLYFFIKWLYMFQSIISPSSGATFKKNCTLKLVHAGTSACCMTIAIQQADVPSKLAKPTH